MTKFDTIAAPGAMTSAGRAAHSDALNFAEGSLSLAQPYRPERCTRRAVSRPALVKPCSAKTACIDGIALDPLSRPVVQRAD